MGGNDDRPTRHEDNVFLDGPVRVTADGKLVGAAVPTGVAVWNVATGQLDRVVPTGHRADDNLHVALTWSWGGDRIVFGPEFEPDSPAFLATSVAMDGGGTHVLEDGDRRGIDPQLSPDGAHLAIKTGDVVGVYSMPGGALRNEIKSPALRFAHRYLPDGRLMLFSDGDHMPVEFWSGDGSERLGSVPMPENYHAFDSPDGEWAAFILRSDDGHRLFVGQGPDLDEVFSRAEDKAHGVLALSPTHEALAWLPRGRGREDTVEIIDPGSGESTSLTAEERVLALAWHPEGKTLYTLGATTGVTAWDVATASPNRLPLPFNE